MRWLAGLRVGHHPETRVVDLPDGATLAGMLEALRAGPAGLDIPRERGVFLVNRGPADLTTALRDGDEVLVMHILAGGEATFASGAVGE
jgi:sulfur carrier protein ThiS